MQIKVCDNGFIKVDSYYVQGMQAVAKPHLFNPDASRPSCNCSNGFSETSKGWCAHKKAAFEYLKKGV